MTTGGRCVVDALPRLPKYFDLWLWIPGLHSDRLAQAGVHPE